MLVGRRATCTSGAVTTCYPLEVENVLTEHPAVDQASVVGVAGPVIGETASPSSCSTLEERSIVG